MHLTGHDVSMCNVDQYGSMCDQIRSIDLKMFLNKDHYWETLVSMLRIWSHIDPYWSALHIDPLCPALYWPLMDTVDTECVESEPWITLSYITVLCCAALSRWFEQMGMTI